MAKEKVLTLSWSEDTVIRQHHPLALAARAMCIIEALNDMRPYNVTVDWGETIGVVAAVKALVKEENWDAAGLLLSSLESLVRPHMGENDTWPLDEVL